MLGHTLHLSGLGGAYNFSLNYSTLPVEQPEKLMTVSGYQENQEFPTLILLPFWPTNSLLCRAGISIPGWTRHLPISSPLPLMTTKNASGHYPRLPKEQTHPTATAIQLDLHKRVVNWAWPTGCSWIKSKPRNKKQRTLGNSSMGFCNWQALISSLTSWILSVECESFKYVLSQRRINPWCVWSVRTDLRKKWGLLIGSTVGNSPPQTKVTVLRFPHPFLPTLDLNPFDYFY